MIPVQFPESNGTLARDALAGSALDRGDGGKGHVRWLTEEEYRALCALPIGVPREVTAGFEARES